MGSLFGSGGGQSTTTSGLGQGFGWVAPGMSSLFNTLTSILSGGGSPYPYNLPSQSVAQMTGGQKSALSALQGMAPGQAQAGANSVNTANQIGSGYYMNPNNPALTGALNAENQATTANYMNAVAPSNESTFISAGAPGRQRL